MSKEYKTGYGKPPKASQFKKGCSGNPKGRPKDQKNMHTIISEIMDKKVAITEGGRTRKVRYIEALINQMAAKALNGSTRDQIAILKALDTYAPDLLKAKEMPDKIIIQYVLPNGKTMADYDDPDGPFMNGGSSTSSALETETEDDDDWLK